jgi:hypothetical protein
VNVVKSARALLAGVAPRSVPLATLRTVAYLLWGFLFFVVFQKLLSRWGCTSCVQLTHSLEAPGFNP